MSSHVQKVERPDIVARARDGDRSALDELIDRQGRWLARAAERVVGPGLRSRERVSDVVQGSLHEILRRLPTFEGDSERAFRWWCVRILENHVRRLVARHSRRGPVAPTIESQVAPGWCPETRVRCGECVGALERALGTLAPDLRAVLTMRLAQRLSFAQIAQRLGRTEKATRILLCRARRELHQRLSADDATSLSPG